MRATAPGLMNDDKPTSLRAIFSEALEIADPDERDRYLSEVCGGDAQLRQQIDALVKAHYEAGDFMRLPEPASDEPDPINGEEPGCVIGRYKLLEEIGEGGFGRVFMAEQREPVHRKVALKIIKAGMDTREVIARFEAERQALALMDHPNIARVLDAGATPAGRPFFVMELIHGIPITEYCDRERLSTTDRLRLFLQVCNAVQHAHQKGIIHRDLKPSNIMVTIIDGEPVPKIIDFGVAKALGQRLTEKTLFTSFLHMIGTPAYMSPEQAELSGAEVDTRSDIYSLGVLLYELLTGVTPFDQETLKKAALDEVRRMIRETDPVKPSTRLHTLGAKLTEVASTRQSDPRALPRLLHGDLDWIVMKALEKDRARRYETSSAMAQDVEAHLDHLPVMASPPSRIYRVWKLVRRNRAAAAGAVLVGLSLVLGLFAALAGLSRAAAERERAESALRRIEIKRAQELFLDDKAAEGIATLATLIRANPRDIVIANWLINELTYRSWPVPVLPPIEHPDHVLNARFSSDGKRILALCRNNTAFIWDAQTGKQISRFELHNPKLVGKDEFLEGLHPIFGAFSPDGTRIITGAIDNCARIWDPATGRELTPPMIHPDWVSWVTFAPDGRTVATACKDGTSRLWDAYTGLLLCETFRHEKWVNFAVFSHDGARLLTGADDGTAKMWDVASGQPIGRKLKHGDVVKLGAFSPDGERVFTASQDHTARIWSVPGGEPLGFIAQHSHTVGRIAVSPDGSRIVTGSFDGTARIWDAFEGGPLTGTLRHDSRVRSVSFSPDAMRVVTAAEDGTARVWDVITGDRASEPMAHNGFVWSAEWSPDGRRVVTASADRTVRIWDVRPGRAFDQMLPLITVPRDALWSKTGEKIVAIAGCNMIWDVHEWQDLTGYTGRSTAEFVGSYCQERLKAQLGPDEQYLVVSAGKGQVRFWHFDTRLPASDIISVGGALIDAQFAPESRRIVIASSDGSAYVRRVPDGQPLAPPLVHEDAVLTACFSPDGRAILTSCADGKARLWDATVDYRLAATFDHPDQVLAAQFSPDGALFVTLCKDMAARVWDVASGRVIGPPVQHLAPVNWAEFSPDGRIVATASSDRSVRLRVVRTGKDLVPQLVHPAGVQRVHFSHCGRFAATACEDGAARVWDVESGLCINNHFRHSQRLASARFNRDGTRLLTASFDWSAKVWDFPRVTSEAPEWLPALAESVAGLRIDSDGRPEMPPASEYFEMLRSAPWNAARTGEYGSWAAWFTADREKRKSSPSGGRSVSEMAEVSSGIWKRLKDPMGTIYASRLVQSAPTNRHPHAIMAELMARIAPANSPFHLAQLEFHSRKAMEACPERGLLARAEHLLATGRTDEALEIMKTASRSNGASADFWLRWTEMLMTSGRLDEAEAVFNEALRLERFEGLDDQALLKRHYGYFLSSFRRPNPNKQAPINANARQ
jgi:eukaryotic-like serine/threonine-protein kinase